jgi:predicted PurR-regulated permease PerM
MSFWDVIWFIIVTFAFVAYLMVLFHIITDIFRDKGLSGWLKAVWVICLVIVPLLTALVYLIARGRGMAERQASAWSSAKAAQDEYIKSVAGSSSSPAEQIDKAQQLLTAGTITQTEFDALKAKALA